ncbi:hypothetical protein KACHI17_12460 [Sediminibacterium sp. KACHI17]|uniref:O-antigen polymerase n=1 Tax=Sediminibacterium sp. KACHI17 TaxID=1751071 RepID=A0AAT9GIM6_9BACT
MKKFVDKAAFLYILIFFLGQNNFLLTNKLAVNEGLGIGRFRATILVGIILLGIGLLFLKFLIDKSIYSIKVSSINIIAICITLSLMGIHIVRDFLINDAVDFIGVAPLVECFFFYTFFFLTIRGKVYIDSNHIRILSFVIFLNIVLELFFYFKDTISGVSYGPFRAYIAGLTINRNPSFFYPIFAFVVLRFFPFKSYIKALYLVIFFVYVLTLFYRTLYVALLFPFFIDIIRFGRKLTIIDVLRFVFFIIIIIGSLTLIDSIVESQFDFSIVKAFTGRFTSTFTEYSNDDAQKDRVNQIPDMMYMLITNPLGIGFSGLVKDAEVYNYAFYFLHPILYLGWLIGLAYFLIGKRMIIIYKNAKTSLKDRILIFCLFYFCMILTFFPYMNYFTFMSIFICLLQLSTTNVVYTIKPITAFLKLKQTS